MESFSLNYVKYKAQCRVAPLENKLSASGREVLSVINQKAEFVLSI